jgi:hypothetical protein
MMASPLGQIESTKRLVLRIIALLVLSGLLSGTALAADLLNLSTRGFAGTGEETLTPGFVVTGTDSIEVLVKVRGPSLPSSISGRLFDPKFTLMRLTSNGPVPVISNDNWEEGQSAPVVLKTGLAPASPLEPAAVVLLEPGSYTVLVSGVGGATGVALPSVTEVIAIDGIDPIDPLVGTYSLTGFRVDYVDGSTTTDDDFSNVSGAMTISENGVICQTFSINGQTVSPGCAALEVPGSSTLVITQSGCTYEVGYSYKAPNMRTTSPRYICGFDTGFVETDYWIKTSSQVRSLLRASNANNELEPNFGTGIGSLLQ